MQTIEIIKAGEGPLGLVAAGLLFVSDEKGYRGGKSNVKKRKKLVPFKRKMDQGRNGDFHLLSRLRTNITLYAHTPVIAVGEKRRRGRPRKYGDRLGSVDQCAEFYRELAQTLSVFFYGKQRVCSPIRELSC